MPRSSWFLAGAVAVALAPAAFAEKANLSPQRLRDTATHVIRGRVTAVYTRTETDGNWRYTRYVAAVQVEECEKGDGIQQGDLVYVRYWRRGWIGSGHAPASTSGHRGLPAEEDSVRVYLARGAYNGFNSGSQDGGFDVIGANGFQKLAAPGR
jgi:hypothetical protein